MHTLVLNRIGEVLDHLTSHFVTNSRTNVDIDPSAFAHKTIAIAREVGTPDHEIARLIGKRLGWPVYDHELLEVLAAKTGWSLTALEESDERHASWVQSSFESFLGFPGIREEAFVHRLVQLVAELGMRGECVIVGRGAGYMLPAESTVRIRLIAPRADRIARVARERELTIAEAARHVDQVDRYRRDFVKSHFFHDVADPQLYALVLNTSQLSPAACADAIVDALRDCPTSHHAHSA